MVKWFCRSISNPDFISLFQGSILMAYSSPGVGFLAIIIYPIGGVKSFKGNPNSQFQVPNSLSFIDH
jgi:hypothetical protein